MAKVLERARKEAMKMGDEFISVEHLFLALWIRLLSQRNFGN